MAENSGRRYRVALVHDWLTGLRGGERCLLKFLELYPQADIYTLVHEPGTTTDEIDKKVRGTSIIQRFPILRKNYRALLPLFPFIARTVTVKDYDLVISLSHAAAKNVRLVNCDKHICYCFTPMRYIWDMAPVYLGTVRAALLSPLLRWLQRWDRNGAQGVDHFVAISNFVASRIRKFYGRSASVIYPPVSSRWKTIPLNRPETAPKHKRAFLYAGAFVPYKGVEHIIKAFNELGMPLWCVGSGPLEKELRDQAMPNVEFLGTVSDDELAFYYRNCRALLFPALEDFGMIPVEAMMSGAPVIAGYYGATRETIPGLRPWIREAWDPEYHAGVFFPPPRNKRGSKQRGLSARIVEAVRTFIEIERSFERETAIQAASRFTSEQFVNGWQEVVEAERMVDSAGITAVTLREKSSDGHRKVVPFNSKPHIQRVSTKV
ncbi:MAG: glycosyltransferase [Bdellovibrionales bacterium]|nr:glycosyltransferase [Bdellovibrionales bacterium]